MSAVKHIIKSMAGGYVVVAVQAVIGILMVPYLIASQTLGVEKYGLLMLIQSSVALLSVLMDGVRLETARIMGRSVTKGAFIINEINAIALLLSVLLSLVFFLAFEKLATELGHISITEEMYYAILVFVGVFVIEQVYYSLDSYFHALKKSWIANMLSMGDSIARAAVIWLIFSYVKIDLVHYAEAIFLCMAIKYLCARSIVRTSFNEEQSFSLRNAMIVLKDLSAAPVQTLQGLSPYMIFRGVVIFSGVRLGAEQAAIVAIFIQTIRNYFNQAVFSGLRPFILPYLSALKKDDGERKGIERFFWLYQVVVLFIGAIAAMTAEIWFPLWLGGSLGKYYSLAWIVLLGYSIEVGLMLYYYDLIASGKGLGLAYMSFIGAIIGLGVLYFEPITKMGVEQYMWCVTIYVLYWSGLVIFFRVKSRRS